MGATITTLDKIKDFARATHNNTPYTAATTLQDSTDPKVFWQKIRVWAKSKDIEARVQYLPDNADGGCLAGARYFFLRGDGTKWHSIEVRLVVNEAERTMPKAHWARNLLQIPQK